MFKKLLLWVASAAVLFPPLLVSAQSAPPEGTIISHRTKVKDKSGKKTATDKSKPVRRALEAWYEANKKAFDAKDVAAVMALRTGDFHTVTTEGKLNTRADMEQYTRQFLARIDHFLSQDIDIGTIELEDDLASAEVTQDTVRMQRMPDGRLHKVQARAIQRETWKRTPEGWLLYRVDNVRHLGTWVDGEPKNR